MKITSLQTLSLLAIALILSTCTADDEDTVVIQGEVTEEVSGDPIENATVRITSPQDFNDVFARTNEIGQYALGEINTSEVADLTLTASATNYNTTTRSLTVAPGDNITGFNFELSEEGSDIPGGGDDGDDDDEVSGESAGAARLQLINVAEDFINVRGTGGVENSTITFAVLDSAGRTINSQNAVEVQLNIVKGPGGGEVLLPDRVVTNAQGRIVSNLSSGDSSGVVRIEAVIERDDVGLTIRSEPIPIAIQSGFPYPNRFYIAPDNYNIEGFGIVPGEGVTTYDYAITASVGDRHGNPVSPGTAVDFQSDLGGVIEGSSLTDDNGRASVILRPDGSQPTTHPSGVGFFTISAKTVDLNNNYIHQELEMLFTTRHANISATPSTFAIPSNGSETFSYTVTDRNGNPMAAGTQITVEADGDIELTGDVDFTLGDYLTTGPGRTEFGFTASDADEENDDVNGTSITIRVVAPASGSETSLTLPGTRAKF